MELSPAWPKYIEHLTKVLSPETKEFYEEISLLYISEFGLTYFDNEVGSAKQAVRLRLHKHAGDYIQTLKWFFNYYDELRNNPEKTFIGTKLVKSSDYSLYCKGIYWVATYELMTT